MLTITVFLGFLTLIGLLVGYVIRMYNTLITLLEKVRNGKAQIATQIESRFDAIKVLIDATKHYSTYESATLENVVKERREVDGNSSLEQIKKENNQLEQMVGKLVAISESYPELQASNVYQDAMNSVNKYEANVRHARMIYNDLVTKFNRKIKMFPSNLVARMFNFESREYFEETKSKQDIPSWE